jgi:hypothetical protein
MPAPHDGSPVLFLHGFWHGSWCWTEVLASVTSAGVRALAVDMAGHGLRARRPAAATGRPFDPELLAAEVSPVAAVDLDQAGDLLVSQVKQLGGDVDPATADAAIGLLTPDAPAGISTGATTLTADGWGSIPRTYVLCTRDLVVPPALQRKFIADADAAFPANPTTVRTLDSSHSPFLSMPAQLADLVLEIVSA